MPVNKYESPRIAKGMSLHVDKPWDLMYKALEGKQKEYDKNKMAAESISTLVSANAIEAEKGARDAEQNRIMNKASMLIYSSGGDYSVIGDDLNGVIKDAYKSKTTGALAAYDNTFNASQKLNKDLQESGHNKELQDMFIKNEMAKHFINGGTHQKPDGSWYSYGGAQVPKRVDVLKLLNEHLDKAWKENSVELKQYKNNYSQLFYEANENGSHSLIGINKDGTKVEIRDANQGYLLTQSFLSENKEAAEQIRMEAELSAELGWNMKYLNSPDGKVIADKDFIIPGIKTTVKSSGQFNGIEKSGYVAIEEDPDKTMRIKAGDQITFEQLQEIKKNSGDYAMSQLIARTVNGSTQNKLSYDQIIETHGFSLSNGGGSGGSGEASTFVSPTEITLSSGDYASKVLGSTLDELRTNSTNSRKSYEEFKSGNQSIIGNISYDQLDGPTVDKMKDAINKMNISDGKKKEKIQTLNDILTFKAGVDNVVGTMVKSKKGLDNAEYGFDIYQNSKITGDNGLKSGSYYFTVSGSDLLRLRNGGSVNTKIKENGEDIYAVQSKGGKIILVDKNRKVINKYKLSKDFSSEKTIDEYLLDKFDDEEFNGAKGGAVMLKGLDYTAMLAEARGKKSTTKLDYETNNKHFSTINPNELKVADSFGLKELADKSLSELQTTGEIDGEPIISIEPQKDAIVYTGQNNNNLFMKYDIVYGKGDSQKTQTILVSADKSLMTPVNTKDNSIYKANNQSALANMKVQSNMSLFLDPNSNSVFIDGVEHTREEGAVQFYFHEMNQMWSKTPDKNTFSQNFGYKFNGKGDVIFNSVYGNNVYNSYSYSSPTAFNYYKSANGFTNAFKDYNEAKSYMNSISSKELRNAFDHASHVSKDEAIHFANQVLNMDNQSFSYEY